MISFNKIEVAGHTIFYREAGSRLNPTLLLLHGFPTSSHMFRNLIPLLADRYHVVAPDLPGFGLTETPEDLAFEYTFDNLAAVIGELTDAMGLKRYALYVFDYGAPVGWRLARARPERVTALISQNGNAYEEGLSAAWDPIRAYWHDASPVKREALRGFLTLDTTKWQYVDGVRDESQVAPEAYLLDAALLARPGNMEIQLDLFRDYANNVAMYPKLHEYFLAWKPAFLAVWGKNDPFFLPAGAEAFRRHLPDAEINFFDTGHFALETHVEEIAVTIRNFLDRALR